MPFTQEFMPERREGVVVVVVGGGGEGAGWGGERESARERQNSDIVSDNPEGIPCE
jgi:glutathione synthase/RimK-type ligase-like ATP-grasp enzyme